ncbi:hypothetical protein [Natronobacterium gregoryi]|uniref:Uncharacterized protein n=2 Tax=Natronobacterium gregoryi TaxID=44930 RepID=L0AN53_NATGS|nr:hypothetical protein [Natronobacterium gregoryi]AFZ74607.1 hypothetical protein Natgr_3488 [Natronobacterium gregoryi SP2]ELY72571.1 hypothetical protein C490_03243 [Natronobacterium gregoryi SP2]SFJ30373.1 hypothetical protein SAMN05443661_12125 [Natronobacterium gregoryi]
MRPNVDITHQLNGRVKEYADANDLDVDAAYTEVIEAGVDELEDDN